MRYFRRFLIVSFCLLMGMLLCSCFSLSGSSSTALSQQDNAPLTPSPAFSPSPSPIATPDPTPAPTPTPTPEPTPHPLTEPVLTGNFIDASYFAPCDEAGTVSLVTYETRDYTANPDQVITKQAAVYLPWNYSPEKEYNILFMMHVSGCNEYYWLLSDHGYELSDGETVGVSIPILLDNMIERGNCPPTIVVAPSGYLNETAIAEHDSARDFEQFRQEFRNDLLPFMRSTYSIAEGRDHVGFYGSSFGAYLNYRSILGPCYDLVSWFVCTGGGQMDPDWLKQEWSSISAQELPMRCLLITEGEYDDRGPVELGYYALNPNFENVIYNIIEQTGHNDNEWIAALYNALQLFYRLDS